MRPRAGHSAVGYGEHGIAGDVAVQTIQGTELEDDPAQPPAGDIGVNAYCCCWLVGWISCRCSQPDAWIAKTVMLFVGIGLSVAGYVTMHTLLGSSEMESLWALVK